eukprot:g16775.t1
MIVVHVAEGRALVWSAEGARRLREEHRLCGSPVGSLARQPRQNGRLGLPLLLLPEEARLLAEGGLGLLVRAPREGEEEEEEEEEEEDDEEGSEGRRDRYRAQLERSHSEQRQLALREKRTLLQAISDRIREGREAKRRRLRENRGE